jgi:TPR repeat protein
MRCGQRHSCPDRQTGLGDSRFGIVQSLMRPQTRLSCSVARKRRMKIVFRMSVSIHALFTPEELTLELEWLKACDTLLGYNYVKQDVKRALELAAASEHPECQVLTSLFAGKSVTIVIEARDVFLADEKKSPASLCFAALLSHPCDLALLQQSANLGYSLAQARMASETIGEERFLFAKSAATQQERDGFFWLGWCYEFSIGCEKDLNKARECYLVAAQLFFVWSMTNIARLLDESDLERWVWWGRTCEPGFPNSLLNNFSAVVLNFNSGSGNGAAVFQIGKALNGQVNVEKRAIFSISDDFDNRIGPANSAISFYKYQLSACRGAVDAWTLCASRIGVVKDIRVLIGNLVWDTRDLAFFKGERRK